MDQNNSDSNGATTNQVQGAGELRSTATPMRTVLQGETFASTEVRYSAIENQAIFEGDIVLGSVEEMEKVRKRIDNGVETLGVAISGAQFRWPQATVFYTIDPSLPNRQRVQDAIAHWEAKTKIRFVERTGAHAAEQNFVTFRPGSGCSSQVGMRGGQQFITLGPNCTAGNAIHEIGHTVGLWHEQSREDRDTFVKVDFTNIMSGLEHNFDQHITDGDDIGGYDYGSIMHYPPNAFAKDQSKPTIIPLKPTTAQIGQRSGLSEGDIAAVQALYP